jgi:hypothetical protein
LVPGSSASAFFKGALFCLGVEAVGDSFQGFSELVAAVVGDQVCAVAELVGDGVGGGRGELEQEGWFDSVEEAVLAIAGLVRA